LEKLAGPSVAYEELSEAINETRRKQHND
jgi:hypothetical protein